ncbi:hypothetical protein C731_3167 [Mycolicibacterium hassiacum DSM 44199]|uniref:Uncharacterized protein n=1 Tax=Mycolicibacterium hassiacum (strain DSM 44199 / CIP 105218 / JCM 12690 / 3849) TaxID=1122247 RepID=K5B804_MYCHD|nr:hypothetical protein C731_3167 [Mycolicibacterium hassiacum DSM 44199]
MNRHLLATSRNFERRRTGWREAKVSAQSGAWRAGVRPCAQGVAHARRNRLA